MPFARNPCTPSSREVFCRNRERTLRQSVARLPCKRLAGRLRVDRHDRAAPVPLHVRDDFPWERHRAEHVGVAQRARRRDRLRRAPPERCRARMRRSRARRSEALDRLRCALPASRPPADVGSHLQRVAHGAECADPACTSASFSIARAATTAPRAPSRAASTASFTPGSGPILEIATLLSFSNASCRLVVSRGAVSRSPAGAARDGCHTSSDVMERATSSSYPRISRKIPGKPVASRANPRRTMSYDNVLPEPPPSAPTRAPPRPPPDRRLPWPHLPCPAATRSRPPSRK